MSLRDLSHVEDMKHCVLHVTQFVQIPLRSTTHTHTDKYDAARSVSWLPEVSSTISPACSHMGVPCALLKQADYLYFNDARSTTVCFAPGVTWFACCRGKTSSNNNTETHARSDIRQRNSTLANLLAYANLVPDDSQSYLHSTTALHWTKTHLNLISKHLGKPFHNRTGSSIWSKSHFGPLPCPAAPQAS